MASWRPSTGGLRKPKVNRPEPLYLLMLFSAYGAHYSMIFLTVS
jgi:hypothetical protein